MCAIADTLHRIMCFIGQMAKSYVFYRTESQKKGLRIPRCKLIDILSACSIWNRHPELLDSYWPLISKAGPNA
jgi:hypothetical protein